MQKGDVDTAHQLLAAAVVENSWSFLSIEKRAVRTWVAFITKGAYAPPRRRVLTGITSSIYARMRSALLADISGQTVSITTDGAVLTNGHPYVTVTGHYITHDWQLRGRRAVRGTHGRPALGRGGS
jgi:hypothetical protein